MSTHGRASGRAELSCGAVKGEREKLVEGPGGLRVVSQVRAWARLGFRTRALCARMRRVGMIWTAVGSLGGRRARGGPGGGRGGTHQMPAGCPRAETPARWRGGKEGFLTSHSPRGVEHRLCAGTPCGQTGSRTGGVRPAPRG